MRRPGQGKKLADAARLLARGDLHLSERDAAPADDATEGEHVNAALAAYGLVLERPAAPPREDASFWLWPEHVPALDLWLAVQTQWRYGMDGATGLDYAGVAAVMAHLPTRKRRRLFGELRIMERAALAVWDERRDEEARSRRR